LSIALNISIVASFTSIGVSDIVARSSNAHNVWLVSTNWGINHWANISFSISRKTFSGFGAMEAFGRAERGEAEKNKEDSNSEFSERHL